MSNSLQNLAVALVFVTVCAHGQSQPENVRIEEAAFVQLGGIDQWVTIRGNNASNPILLHIHGGPGRSFSAFTSEFAPYESDFTVVQWDQRGSGRTFGRYGEATPDVNIDRIVRDGIELAAYLDNRLPNRQLIIFGHSLGSIIGIEMARRSPGSFAAYVGTAQFSSFPQTVRAQIDYLGEVADASDNEDLAAQLQTIDTTESQLLQQFFAVNRLLFSSLPPADMAWFQQMQARAMEEYESDRAGRLASRNAGVGQLADARGFAN